MSYNFSTGVACRFRVERNGREILRQHLPSGTHDIEVDPGDKPGTLVAYLLLEGAAGETCMGSQTFSAFDIGRHLLAKSKALKDATPRQRRGLLIKAMRIFLERCGSEAVPLLAQTFTELSNLHLRVKSSKARQRAHLGQAIVFRERALGIYRNALADKKSERAVRVELSLLCICFGDYLSARMHALAALEIERAFLQSDSESSYVYSTAALAYSKTGQNFDSDRVLVEGISRLKGDIPSLTRLLLARWHLMPAPQVD